jgi:hypothetical protein
MNFLSRKGYIMMGFPYSIQSLYAFITKQYSNRHFLPMHEAMAHPSPPPSSVVLRLDVERALSHQLKNAKYLNSNGIRATFYFHTRRNCYNPRILHAIQDLGHEVGYHHECLNRTKGNFDKARDLFLREVDLFRKDGLDLYSVCSHGEAGLPKQGFKENWDLFLRFPDLLAQTDLKGETYMWLRDHGPLYASDTFRKYSRFWNVLKNAQANPEEPLVVLAHLHRWHFNPVKTVSAISRDLFQQANNRFRKKRNYRLAYS